MNKLRAKESLNENENENEKKNEFSCNGVNCVSIRNTKRMQLKEFEM